MPTQKLWVPQMKPADEATITAALDEMDGVLYVVASHLQGCVEVEFEDDCVTIEEVVRRLSQLGFAAAPAG
jgi:copper chaperone CopZ